MHTGKNASAATAAQWICGVGLLWGAILLIYGQTLGHGAIAYDDFEYLPQGEGGRSLFSGLLSESVVNLWHPLTVLSHRLLHLGVGDAYGVHHLLNILLHGAAATFLFLWVGRASGRPLVGFFCALVWAVHPVCVEPVAWISGRKDVLLAALLSAGLAVSTYRKGRSLALVLLLAAFLAKPLAVVIPILVTASPIYPGGGAPGGRRWTHRVAPVLFLAAGLLAALTLTFQYLGGQGGGGDGRGLAERLAGACWAFAESFRHLVLPSALHLGYEDPASVSALLIVSVVLLLGAGIFAAWKIRKTYPNLAVGTLWLIVPLLPTVGLLHAGNSLVADRYLYLPLFGLLLIVVPLLFVRSRLRKLGAAGLVALAIVLGTLSYQQVGTWRDTESVFGHVLAIDPGHALAHSKLGERIVLEGGDPVIAHDHLTRALARRPEDPGAHLYLGILKAQEGRHAEAVPHYETTLRYWPELPWVHSNSAGCQWASGAHEAAWEALRKAPAPKGQALWLQQEQVRLLSTGPRPAKMVAEVQDELRRLVKAEPGLLGQVEDLRSQLAHSNRGR